MAVIPPKPLSDYPWLLRWFFRRQARKYGTTLAPFWLWGRLPAHFVGMLGMLGLFQRRSFPIDTALRSLVSIRVAQLNGCNFCVDLNAYNLLSASGSMEKASKVSEWRNHQHFTPRERAALDYAEAVTDTARRAGPVQFEALRAHFTDDDIVALTAWIAFQNLSAKFNAALGAEEQGLCSLPNPSRSVRPPLSP
ncbi:MAG: carboxymuconolactone decarboxylase family protein [Verrucomicrobiales bacterium]|nr:carboxymuconolactone decarboxylase family protein [Verrucomicrobiales bacterium]